MRPWDSARCFEIEYFRNIESGVFRAPAGRSLDGCGAERHHADMLIYKIFRAPEWQVLVDHGETTGAPIDVTDGFVHFSTAAQAAETAAKHFTAEEGLILVALEADALGDALKWEVSRGGALFPHLYRKMQMADVLWHKPLPLVDGSHQFPEDMA